MIAIYFVFFVTWGLMLEGRRTQRFSVDNVAGRMGYLARLISTQLLDKMGSWEGDPFVVKIVIN